MAPHAEPQSVFQKTECITGFLGPSSGMISSCAEITGTFMHPSNTTNNKYFFQPLSHAPGKNKYLQFPKIGIGK